MLEADAVCRMILAARRTSDVKVPRRWPARPTSPLVARLTAELPASVPNAVSLAAFLDGVAECTHGGPLHTDVTSFRKWSDSHDRRGAAEDLAGSLGIAQFDSDIETKRGGGVLAAFVPATAIASAPSRN